MSTVGMTLRIFILLSFVVTVSIFASRTPQSTLPLTAPPGIAGAAGESCWDRNKNGVCDLTTEDINGDGVCDWKDCQGLECWDLNGNGICDPNEDINQDGNCTILDCQGPQGIQGTPCWDLNNNGICDPNEDINHDGNCTVLDCKGPQGQQGAPCWDLNNNGICDPNEDINHDGNCTVLDCKGPQGQQGTPCWDLNNNGICDPNEDTNHDGNCTILDCKGPQGIQGTPCWDLNNNGICDPNEDTNHDGNCTILDCKGPQGIQGTPCWDLNNNGICDPNEDINHDGNCTILDCKGPQGTNCWDLNNNGICDPNEDINHDGNCTVLDCKGPQGLQGLDGLDCWDLNRNGLCDLFPEDKNNDGVCNALDCQGAVGPPGAVEIVPNSCLTNSDCSAMASPCSINTCINNTCNFALPVGRCITNVHCSGNQECQGCTCVDLCNTTTCRSHGCMLRYCEYGLCKELNTGEDGCCNNETDCLGTSTVYYFTSGLFTDKITSKSPGSAIQIEGVSMNDGSLSVPNGLYTYSPSFFNSSILADNIQQYTSGNGVTIETILHKAGVLTSSSTITDSVTAKTTNGDLTLAGAGTGNVALTSTLKVDTIVGKTSTSVSAGGVTLNSGAIGGASLVLSGTFSAASITADSVTAKTANTDLTLSGAGTGLVSIATTLKTDAITAKTANTDLSLSGAGTGLVSIATTLKTDTITAKTVNTDLSLSGAGTGIVTVTTNLKVDTIVGRSTSTVTVGGVTHLSGAVTASSLVADSLTAKTVNTDLSLAGSGTGIVSVTTNLKVDTIVGRSTASLSAGGVTLNGGAVTATGAVTAPSLVSDSLTAKTANTDLSLAGTGTGIVSVTTNLKVDTVVGRSTSTVTVGGVAHLTGGITLLTSGGTAASLNYYEETVVVEAISGLWGVTTFNANFKFVRIGKQITLTWGAVRNNAACTTTAVVVSPTGAVASKFRSGQDLYFPVIIEDNGIITHGTMVIVNSSGTITWYNGNLPSSGTYTCSSTVGTSGIMAGSVTYYFDTAP